jgi:3-hydroxymyristoyl/3-hydroxydecanoyl-(acyl carrier protein) dehydratase
VSEPFARVEIEGDVGRALVRPEHALALCAGHFPGDPFLPGAYLLELMAALAERVAAPARVQRVVRCTFTRRVRPGGEIVVTARAAGAVVEAKLEAGGEPAARATLRLS